jgi:prepilin-type N-terminal cleavage/methylation domain-containing protein
MSASPMSKHISPYYARLRAGFTLIELLLVCALLAAVSILAFGAYTNFEAKLAQGPSAQKAEYLKKVLGMMGISEIQAVGQRMVLEYGGDRPLAAYIEDKAAQRIVREAKAGGRYTFYAFHVYNNRQGPALVVTSFQETGKVGKE